MRALSSGRARGTFHQRRSLPQSLFLLPQPLPPLAWPFERGRILGSGAAGGGLLTPRQAPQPLRLRSGGAYERPEPWEAPGGRADGARSSSRADGAFHTSRRALLSLRLPTGPQLRRPRLHLLPAHPLRLPPRPRLLCSLCLMREEARKAQLPLLVGQRRRAAQATASFQAAQAAQWGKLERPEPSHGPGRQVWRCRRTRRAAFQTGRFAALSASRCAISCAATTVAELASPAHSAARYWHAALPSHI